MVEGISGRVKRYVSVTARMDEDGRVRPLSIQWYDGKTYPIDEVKDVRPAPPLIQARSHGTRHVRRKARPSCAKPAHAHPAPLTHRMCRLRTCVLCEETRFPPCSAGGTRARPRITRRWHRATAERQGGLQNGKSSSHHHAGQEPGALPPLERRPRHSRALAQVLRAPGLPPPEPGLLRVSARHTAPRTPRRASLPRRRRRASPRPVPRARGRGPRSSPPRTRGPAL